MIFDTSSSATYPRCTLHMKHDLNPTVLKKHRPIIFDAFVKACGTKNGAIKALTWGEFPKVAIGAEFMKDTNTNSRICGSNPPEIFDTKMVIVSAVRAVPLEKCLADIDLINNKRRFESTLLHEMVHYVRRVNKLLGSDYDFPDSPEPGEQFEFWAYGALQCSNDEIFDALLSYR